MIRQSITVDQALEVLNRAVESDPEAIKNLIETRIPCNDKLSADPEIQVGIYHIGKPTVGVLGLLNGLFGEQDGWGAFCAVFKVKCSQDASHDVNEAIGTTDRCPVCHSSIVIDKLVEFSKTPAIK